MITIEEARIQQKKAEKKCIAIFFTALVILVTICAVSYFAFNQAFYITLGLSIVALVSVGVKVKITEFFSAKEYEGGVYHYEINAKRKYARFRYYTVFEADLYVKDKNGTIIKKTFVYTKDYDAVQARDKAVVLRFVDKPVVYFQNETSCRFGKDKGDRTTDWMFDFLSLPKWNTRERFPFVYDKFHHINNDTLCCIYSITEVRMLDYIGCLAILKNKENPRLILNVAENMWFNDNFSVNNRGNIIFLQPDLYDKSKEKTISPILIIDVESQRFSYFITDNYNPCYKVVEISENVFGIQADETQKSDERLMALCKKQIDLRTLEWFELEEIGELSEKIFN